jgi:hypothetical protein
MSLAYCLFGVIRTILPGPRKPEWFRMAVAQITYARTGELLRRLFEILMQAPDGIPAGEAMKCLESVVPPTPYEQGEFPSGGRRFDKIVRFATVDCVKAGWLAKHKGVWLVTEAGRQAHKSFVDPEGLYRQAVKLYQAWKASQPGASGEAATATLPAEAASLEDTAVEKSAGVTYEQADEQAWAEIEQFLHGIGPSISNTSWPICSRRWGTTWPGSLLRARTGESTLSPIPTRSALGRHASRCRSGEWRRR